MGDPASLKYVKDDGIDRETLSERNVPIVMRALGLSEEEARAYAQWDPRTTAPTRRPRCTPQRPR